MKSRVALNCFLLERLLEVNAGNETLKRQLIEKEESLKILQTKTSSLEKSLEEMTSKYNDTEKRTTVQPLSRLESDMVYKVLRLIVEEALNDSNLCELEQISRLENSGRHSQEHPVTSSMFSTPRSRSGDENDLALSFAQTALSVVQEALRKRQGQVAQLRGKVQEALEQSGAQRRRLDEVNSQLQHRDQMITCLEEEIGQL